MLRVGTILRGIYRIDSYLSSGGFGNTYVATNIEFNERYAIKEFFMKGVTQRDDNNTTVSVSNSENEANFLQQKEKFKKEARRLRQLKNSHIVSVYDLFEENGTAYYVMDYIDGENLSESMKRTGRSMTEEEVSNLLPQLLDALKVVHDANMLHLDLKPANIMVDKNSHVKLIDFGASKQLDSQTGGATATTAISYTNGYAPREQMEQNYDKFGPWTDIYALGATLYKLLTTNNPPLPSDIDDDNTEDKHHALPMPKVSNTMRNLILWMMKTNRQNRPQSVFVINDYLKATTYKAEGTSTQVPEKDFDNKPITNNKIGNEETIIQGNSQKPSEKPNSHEDYTNNLPQQDDENENSHLKIIVAISVIALFILSYFASNCNGYSSKSETQYDSLAVDSVEADTAGIEITTSIGKCEYWGELDENYLPIGKGIAAFNDGRYYKGPFSHGVIEGANGYFKYPNGDSFEGEFRNNRFYKGTYKIASSGEYFTGTFNSDGKPFHGKWYNKNNEIIQTL